MHVLIDIGIRNVLQLQRCYCDVVDRSLFTLVPVSITRLFCTYSFRIRKIIVKYRYWFSSRDNRVTIFYNWFAVRYIYTSLWNLNVFFSNWRSLLQHLIVATCHKYFLFISNIYLYLLHYIAAKVKCIYGNVTDVLEGRQNILFTIS